MGTINFSGLASGLDTGAIVTQLLAIRRRPITRMEERKSSFEKQITALQDLQSKLIALKDAAAALDTPNEFGSLTASSSHETILTATASSLAAPGSYQLTVNSLAAAQKDLSQGYSTLVDSVGSGSLTVTVNGEETVIDIDPAGSSLADLRDAINDAGAGVYASILNDGSDTAPYRLILTSSETGADHAFTVDMSGLSGGTTPVMTNVTTAADASLVIDTVPVSSASNTVAGAVTGMTFNLLDFDPATTVTVNVNTDAEAITEKIQTFVDAYNDLLTFVETQSLEEATLRGNSTMRTVSSRIRTLVTLPRSGGSGAISLLAQVGITQGEGGQLTFDTAEFADQLSESYSDVRDLFVERGENLGKAYLIRTAVDDLTDSVDGLFKISTDALNDRIDHLDDTILRYERSLDSYQTYLERKFTAMEMLVSNLQAQGGFLTSMGY